MTAVMHGVRIVEVAEHTFVPASAALMSDWGADVIKIEHVERGDAMRGVGDNGLVSIGAVNWLIEHSNRGKRSLGLDLASGDGLDILYRLVATADVFLTNKLPAVRRKLKIDVDDIRAANPGIIYVRGTGQGERGPDADQGSYDSLAYWARSGIAASVTRPEYGHVVPLPGLGFGDSNGAMALAAGMMGALFHRERTGEAPIVDASLFGTAIWAMGQTLAASLFNGIPWGPRPPDAKTGNPISRTYLTHDARFVALGCLQAGRYWAEVCSAIERPELAVDPRFADHDSLIADGGEAVAILAEVFASRPLAHWRERLARFSGQWTVVQNTLEVADDPQAVENGYIQECTAANGTAFQLAAAPVQFDEVPAAPGRAPEFNEHGDAILGELGFDYDKIIDLKLAGVVA